MKNDMNNNFKKNMQMKKQTCYFLDKYNELNMLKRNLFK